MTLDFTTNLLKEFLKEYRGTPLAMSYVPPSFSWVGTLPESTFLSGQCARRGSNRDARRWDQWSRKPLWSGSERPTQRRRNNGAAGAWWVELFE